MLITICMSYEGKMEVKMKKIISAVLAGLMAVLTLTSCSNDKNSSGDGTGVSTIKNGVLKIGMEQSYPPLEYLDEDGTTLIGFDVEFGEAIAEKMGLKAEFINNSFDTIGEALNRDVFDVAISAISITDERKESHLLSKPYIENKISLVTAKDKGLNSPEDLKGKKVAVQRGTTADIFMTDLVNENSDYKDGDIARYDSVMNCFEELKHGRADAVIVDIVVANYYIGSDTDSYSITWQSDEPEPFGIQLKKGNDALLEEIEKAVDAIYADGTVDKIVKKYFGEEAEMTIKR